MSDRTYSISELASEFGITTRTIRFYEEQGLVAPGREGRRRIYSAADRVRIKLILRGKRIGMSLKESAEVIDLYDPEHDNREQLNSLITSVREKRARLLQQRRDIDDMLQGLDEVQALCEQALEDNHRSGG
jgi:DNA-binding transcriptional MerR regulator